MAKWTAVRYSADHMLDYFQLDENLSIFEVDVPEKWVGKTVAEIDVRKKFNINIMGVFADGKISATIGPDTVFKAEHPILVMGNFKDVQKCFKL